MTRYHDGNDVKKIGDARSLGHIRSAERDRTEWDVAIRHSLTFVSRTIAIFLWEVHTRKNQENSKLMYNEVLSVNRNCSEWEYVEICENNSKRKRWIDTKVPQSRNSRGKRGLAWPSPWRSMRWIQKRSSAWSQRPWWLSTADVDDKIARCTGVDDFASDDIWASTPRAGGLVAIEVLFWTVSSELFGFWF